MSICYYFIVKKTTTKQNNNVRESERERMYPEHDYILNFYIFGWRMMKIESNGNEAKRPILVEREIDYVITK